MGAVRIRQADMPDARITISSLRRLSRKSEVRTPNRKMKGRVVSSSEGALSRVSPSRSKVETSTRVPIARDCSTKSTRMITVAMVSSARPSPLSVWVSM